MCVCVCVCACARARACVCMCVHMRAWMCSCVFVCARMCLCKHDFVIDVHIQPHRYMSIHRMKGQEHAYHLRLLCAVKIVQV